MILIINIKAMVIEQGDVISVTVSTTTTLNSVNTDHGRLSLDLLNI